MKRVKELRPSRGPLPGQCCMTIQRMTSPVSQFYTKYRKAKASNRGYDTDRCQKAAKYEIDGQQYCAFHGGIKALDILLERESEYD